MPLANWSVVRVSQREHVLDKIIYPPRVELELHFGGIIVSVPEPRRKRLGR